MRIAIWTTYDVGQWCNSVKRKINLRNDKSSYYTRKNELPETVMLLTYTYVTEHHDVVKLKYK